LRFPETGVGQTWSVGRVYTPSLVEAQSGQYVFPPSGHPGYGLCRPLEVFGRHKSREMALGMWRIADHALMSDACDHIPHHGHPVSSVVFFGIPTSSLDTPHKSCDNGAKAIEDTPDEPTRTTHHAPLEERRNHG
jgi:hypothetical protein